MALCDRIIVIFRHLLMRGINKIKEDFKLKKAVLILAILGLASAFSLIGHADPIPYFFHLTFDDGTANDSSGNGNNGELFNGATVTGGALVLDGGANQYVEVMADVPEVDFTISIRINTASPDVGVLAVLEQATGAGGHDRHFFLVGGNINFRVYAGGAWSPDPVVAVADGEWHHIALVVETGVGQTAYVDGAPVGTNEYDLSDFNWQDRVWIGFSNDAANQYFTGLIDNAAYISAALTADEVANLIAAVEPAGKVTTTWSSIKTKY